MARAFNRYLEGHGLDSRWELRKFFFWVFRLENASSLFTLYPNHQSIYHLFIFIISTRWALQYGRTHVTHKNLVYDLAHHESPIAQWLERPTGIWKVMGTTPIGGSENSFSEYFVLRTLLHYLHKVYYCSIALTFHIVNSIWKVMGTTPIGGSENSSSEYVNLRRLLLYLHFIQVTNLFIIYSHLSFRHVAPCSIAGHMSHI